MKHIKPRSGKLMVEISHKSSEPSSVGANISLTIIYMLVPTGLYFVVHFCFYQKVVPTGLLFFLFLFIPKGCPTGFLFLFVLFYTKRLFRWDFILLLVVVFIKSTFLRD